MIAVIEEFRENMSHVIRLGGLYAAISKLVTSAIDASDILRSQHVLAVSALDCFVHSLAREGMLEVFDGKRPATSAYLRFRIAMTSISGVASKADLRANFEAEIRTQHSYLSFQQPDKIGDAVRLFSDIPLWDCVSKDIGLSSAFIKEKLKLVVDRRNKIAHEADRDPSFPGARWPVSSSDVDDVVQFVIAVGEAIFNSVNATCAGRQDSEAAEVLLLEAR